MTSDGNSYFDRRRRFVQALYGLNAALSQEGPAVAKARQKLAKLRRSFSGPQREVEAYSIVFPFDPPAAEQRAWLLVAGLFALHPQPPTARWRSVGGAMQVLAAGGRGDPARRRLEQLLSVGGRDLPHYLRQVMTLLRSAEITLDFHMLLDDLVVLLSHEFTADAAHTVRLRWARDFYRPQRPARGTDQSDTPAAASAEPATA
ncbi:type I-E CRISPR-associated protein Cse2/CasB [Dactylosporangium fulvum]|uniref:Type I-E CRISPR-associated protein Cse2/CasB n=1 Tax=Dactylosporangium fulvum TaxID=53359 RepID=A0ABY5VVL4_9ACTN|nr:type I-E CRISPR-associated protein Cse2/CasB [Dactylosporangium fulvum]UWP81267.1 type I-E CRISPR-associated protein Cse2/CasB [Dactylosporangium fulvum]